MATHDYIISNASGASVRADLNNALAAIVSNNSNATSPATTYAYQWWADTTTGQLKLRNSANNAWITIFELDGTMLMEDGTLAAPGLAFASDLDTGFSRSAANKINFSTGGAERLEIGSSEVVFNDPSNDVDFRVESNNNANMLFVDAGNDRVGIGAGAPGSTVHVFASNPELRLQSSGASTTCEYSMLGRDGSDVAHKVNIKTSDSALTFGTGGSSGNSYVPSERMRIDSAGRLLVGHSSSRTVDAQMLVQIEGTTQQGSSMSLVRNSNDAAPPNIVFGKSRGTSTGSNTVVQSGDDLGIIQFFGADGTDANSSAASIKAEVDGTPGSNDMPGRLVFSTTADGASSTTERLRIDSGGRFFFNENSSDLGHKYILSGNESADVAAFQYNSNTGTYLAISTGAPNGVVELKADARSGSYPPLSFKTGASEQMRIDSSGRVGIGTTSPSTTLSIGASASSSYNGGVCLNRGSSTYNFYEASDGTNSVIFGLDNTLTVAKIGSVNSYPIGFFTGNAERVRIDSSGNVGIGLTPAYSGVFGGSQRVLHVGGSTAPGVRLQSSTSNQGDFIIQTSNSGGKTVFANLSSNADTVFHHQPSGSDTETIRFQNSGGISFNGDTATANALDDYEQGSWTPVFADSGFTYSNQYGRYTKIGNRLWFNFFLTWSANTATGNAAIQGLPFAQGANEFQYYGACSLTNNGLTLPSGTNNFVVQISPTTPQLVLYGAKSGAAKQSVPNSNCGSSGEIIMSGHYLVAE